MFHHVRLNHRQRRTRLIGHGVHSEIKAGILRQKNADLQTITQRLWLHGLFIANNFFCRLWRIAWYVSLFNHLGARAGVPGDHGLAASREIRVAI